MFAATCGSLRPVAVAAGVCGVPSPCPFSRAGKDFCRVGAASPFPLALIMLNLWPGALSLLKIRGRVGKGPNVVIESRQAIFCPWARLPANKKETARRDGSALCL